MTMPAKRDQRSRFSHDCHAYLRAAPAGTSGTTYARFRLSTDAAFITAMNTTGVATSGEVKIIKPRSHQHRSRLSPRRNSAGQAATVDAGDWSASTSRFTIKAR